MTITCRDCGTTFPKPQRRGRPPVVCDSCKGGKKAPESPSEPQGDIPTPATPVQAPSVAVRASKKAPYVSGYCNVRHSPEIHRICSGLGGACNCACHKEAT